MRAEDLVDGAEYEGYNHRNPNLNKVRRGKLRFVENSVVAILEGSAGDLNRVWLDTLRRVEPVNEKPIAEKGRLFEGEYVCCFCGADKFNETHGAFSSHWPSLGFMGAGYESKLRCCESCRDTIGGETDPFTAWRAADREAVRRKSLVSGSPVRLSSDGGLHAADKASGSAEQSITEAAQHVSDTGEPERSPADEAAWKLREETLAAEERKRRHLEERRLAYRDQRSGDAHEGNWGSDAVGVALYKWRRGIELDAAIARAKPAEDGPAYVNRHWGPQGSGPGWED